MSVKHKHTPLFHLLHHKNTYNTLAGDLQIDSRAGKWHNNYMSAGTIILILSVAIILFIYREQPPRR